MNLPPIRIQVSVICVFATIFSTRIFAEEPGSRKHEVTFRKSQVGLHASATAPEMRIGTASQASVQNETLSEKESLAEQQQTLENEVRYGKAKLEAAQKKLAVQSAAGNVEQADRANQEVKDWEARLQASRAQLAQVEAELQKSSSAQLPVLAGGDVIAPGENLEVFVVEDPSFNGRYQVRRGGYIILPQVGRIAVAGKTLDAAEAAVRRALQSSQLQHASVILERISGADLESGPLIYLSGAFKNPRPYRIPAGTAPTLVGVILSCGGISDKADLTRVKVMRVAAHKGIVEEVNVQRILDGGGLTSDITLTEGDVITIPVGTANLIYVTGNVKRQGSYHLVQGERLTAYGAILQSGGFAKFADLKHVHVLRALPDGTKAKLQVNVVAIQKGQTPDVILQSGDIVVVPEKWFSF